MYYLFRFVDLVTFEQDLTCLLTFVFCNKIDKNIKNHDFPNKINK